MRPEDSEGLYRRRNDPEVARYQNWELPYPKDRSEKLISGVVALEGPTNEEWWMAAVEDSSGSVIGDLAVNLTWQGRSAEIGYTLGHQHWGQGYAVEAVSALLRYLFDDLGLTRVWGMLHPDNPASAMVLERAGMLFEGHTRGSFWVGDENSDDWIYGMLKEDWEAWVNRPRTSPAVVALGDVTAANLGGVMGLRTHRSQERFVKPMGRTIAQAWYPDEEDGAPVVPWLKTIVADDEIVGAVMVALQTEAHPEPYLWRMLIDRMHQRRGIATVAMDLVFDHLRSLGSETVLVSWVEGKGSPGNFYTGLGFVPTGEIDEGEVVARKFLGK